jgi:arginine/lysine/ornithine decarboxylase
LAAIQSSSPSYPIMASLDLARRQMAARGEALLGEALETARLLRDGLAAMPWLETAEPAGPAEGRADGPVAGTGVGGVAGEGPVRIGGSITRDPLKVTFRDRTGTLGGRELAAELEARGCFPEMADPVFVTLALGLSTPRDDIGRLLAALETICSDFRLSEKELGEPIKNIYKSPPSRVGQGGAAVPEPVSFRFHRSDAGALRRVPPEKAVGAVCGAPVVPYPPGVPLLLPGETITAEAVRQLRDWQAAGLGIHGLDQDDTIIIQTNGEQP